MGIRAKWQALKITAQAMQKKSLLELFSEDKERLSHFSMTVDEIYWDFSKHFIDKPCLDQLLDLANSLDVKGAIAKLLSGEKVNISEGRPALHTALRETSSSFIMDGQDIMPFIRSQKEKMANIVNKLLQQEWKGATGKAITDVVNLGIGGSDLGPKMAVEALKSYQQSSLKLHFVSNIDPMAILEVLAHLNPETTLFVISSKSFTTMETLTNAQVAKDWLMTNLETKIVEQHFIAITSQREKAKAWGINPAHVLQFEEWVGGRYSVWSTIGFPLALSIGMSHFEDFLLGAKKMDEHFAQAPLAQNMPVLLALIGIWYINGWDAKTLAVLPYVHGLRSLPDYLQQLDMESNGKTTKINGEKVSEATGPIVWGQAGTNGQHAFYQLLHQGTHFVPVDFIVAVESETPLKAQHQYFVAHCLAQAQALMQGNQTSIMMSAHEQMPGNKPSNLFLLNKMTPRALGQLLALYEHKIYIQGVIWEINSFDQPGVELGKKLANKVIHSLETGEMDPVLDPSTCELIRKIRLKDGVRL